VPASPARAHPNCRSALRGGRIPLPVPHDLQQFEYHHENGAWRASFSRLKGHDRYLRGIKSRLGRIAGLPLVKDLETARPEDPALWDYGWMLEEFRLSLFAPDVPLEMKVSEKRLAEGF
jgi:hypothetical protein